MLTTTYSPNFVVMAVGVNQLDAACSDEDLPRLGVASKLVAYQGLNDLLRTSSPLSRRLPPHMHTGSSHIQREGQTTYRGTTYHEAVKHLKLFYGGRRGRCWRVLLLLGTF